MNQVLSELSEYSPIAEFYVINRPTTSPPLSSRSRIPTCDRGSEWYKRGRRGPSEPIAICLLVDMTTAGKLMSFAKCLDTDLARHNGDPSCRCGMLSSDILQVVKDP